MRLYLFASLLIASIQFSHSITRCGPKLSIQGSIELYLKANNSKSEFEEKYEEKLELYNSFYVYVISDPNSYSEKIVEHAQKLKEELDEGRQIYLDARKAYDDYLQKLQEQWDSEEGRKRRDPVPVVAKPGSNGTNGNGNGNGNGKKKKPAPTPRAWQNPAAGYRLIKSQPKEPD
jgi:hypothetical protein